MKPILGLALVVGGWVLGSVHPLQMPVRAPVVIPFAPPELLSGPALPKGWKCLQDRTGILSGWTSSARTYRFERRFDLEKARKILEAGETIWPQVTNAWADSSYTVWVHSTSDADWKDIQPFVNGALEVIGKTAQ